MPKTSSQESRNDPELTSEHSHPPQANNTNSSNLNISHRENHQESRSKMDGFYKFFGSSLEESNMAYVNSLIKNSNLANGSLHSSENSKKIQPVKAIDNLSTILKDNKYEERNPPSSGHQRAKSNFQSPQQPQFISNANSKTPSNAILTPANINQSYKQSETRSEAKDFKKQIKREPNTQAGYDPQTYEEDGEILVNRAQNDYSSLRNAKTESNEDSSVFDGYKKPLSERFKGQEERSFEKSLAGEI